MRKDVSLIQAYVALYTQSINSSKDEEFVKLFTNNYEKGGELKAKLLEISDGAKAEVELLETAYETIKDIQIKFDLSKLEENLIEPKYKELDDINHSLEEKGLEISDDNSLIQSLKYMNIEIKFLSEEQLEQYKGTEIGALLYSRFKVKRSITTYENLVNAQGSSTIKPNFHMWGSLSGRIISYNPSTQNLPKEYKDYILPLRQGESVYELDIKYAEVLGLANLADETVIFDLIKENVDIYNYTFASLFGKKIDAVTPEHRAITKKIVNGINLGIGQSKLAEMINSSEIVKNEITTDQAKKIKETYLNLYPKIKDYAKDIEKKAILTTHEGFEFEVNPSYKNISFAVQNIIATIMKMCLKELANKKEHIINVVHDSIWVSCPEAMIKDIKNIMEQVVRGLLPEELDRYDIELIKLTKLGGK